MCARQGYIIRRRVLLSPSPNHPFTPPFFSELIGPARREIKTDASRAKWLSRELDCTGQQLSPWLFLDACIRRERERDRHEPGAWSLRNPQSRQRHTNPPMFGLPSRLFLTLGPTLGPVRPDPCTKSWNAGMHRCRNNSTNAYIGHFVVRGDASDDRVESNSTRFSCRAKGQSRRIRGWDWTRTKN